MQPGIDHFVNGAQNKSLYQADIEVFAYTTLLLAQFDNFRHQILIHDRHFSDLGFRQAAVLMGFHLVHHGHIPIPLKFGQMPPDEIAQFIKAVVRLFHLSSEPVKHLLGSVAEKLHQNIIFIFEIKIDGTVGHPGLFSDLGNGRLVEALAGKYSDSRFQNEMIFVIFIILVDSDPLPGMPDL